MSRSKRRRFLVGLGAVALLAAAVAAMFWSPVFVVSEVKVVGADRSEVTDVVAAAGITDGSQNLLLLPTEEVRARVRALPWVRDALVERMLPGTVRVRISEREPAMSLSIDSSFWTIDADGHVLSEGRIDPSLPVLAGVSIGRVEPGDRLRTQESQDALAAYEALPRGIRKKVVGVFAPSPERISFTLRDGLDIRVGPARQMRAKGEVLKALLARLRSDGRSAGYIDVRVPTSPAVGGEPAAEAAE